MLDEVLVSRGSCGDDGASGRSGDAGAAAAELLLGRSGVLGDAEGAEGVGNGTFEAGPFELLAASDEEAVAGCLLDHRPNGDERP